MDNREMKTILKLISLKQEEGLLKWLFIPFWGALTATIILVAVYLVLSGTYFIAIMLAFIIVYGIYMGRKCEKRLKAIKEVLSARYKK